MSFQSIDEAALNYHAEPRPGKIAIQTTKPTDSQNDLALAYSPGVAAPVRAIAQDPNLAYRYTAKGNLVGLISNGSAVLGLGNVGALASKPVMEGKSVLFKRFADIDVFDIELEISEPKALIEAIVQMSPTFGAINLEDIKGPDCFIVEEGLKERLSIPVFHDDQHGTAVTVAAGLLNALELQDKNLQDIKLVCLGAGAAGIASMKLLHKLGLPLSQICMVDSRGVIGQYRDDLNTYKQFFAQDTHHRTLADALQGADVFVGLSGPNLVDAAMLETMASRPIIFALSNPDPEVHPELAKRIHPDVIIATGRSDFPNQVNNVLCFPYIFRGALDVAATCINDEMLIAAVIAIRKIVHEPVPQRVRDSYLNQQNFEFGPNYILPTPFDPRLIEQVPAAVARAAIKTQVARAPYPAHYPLL